MPGPPPRSAICRTPPRSSTPCCSAFPRRSSGPGRTRLGVGPRPLTVGTHVRNGDRESRSCGQSLGERLHDRDGLRVCCALGSATGWRAPRVRWFPADLDTIEAEVADEAGDRGHVQPRPVLVVGTADADEHLDAGVALAQQGHRVTQNDPVAGELETGPIKRIGPAGVLRVRLHEAQNDRADVRRRLGQTQLRWFTSPRLGPGIEVDGVAMRCARRPALLGRCARIGGQRRSMGQTRSGRTGDHSGKGGTSGYESTHMPMMISRAPAFPLIMRGSPRWRTSAARREQFQGAFPSRSSQTLTELVLFGLTSNDVPNVIAHTRILGT